MSTIFILKKEPQKKCKFFNFENDRYFVMGDSIDMNDGIFWETSVGFLKSVVLQLFQNIAKVKLILLSKVSQNLTAFKNRQFFSVFHLDVACRTL